MLLLYPSRGIFTQKGAAHINSSPSYLFHVMYPRGLFILAHGELPHFYTCYNLTVSPPTYGYLRSSQSFAAVSKAEKNFIHRSLHTGANTSMGQIPRSGTAEP